MEREHALDAFAADEPAHGGDAADAAALDGDDDAAEDLDALLVAFLDQVVDVDAVADAEVGDRGLHVLDLELPQDVHCRKVEKSSVSVLPGARAVGRRRTTGVILGTM